jgi:hypothetical protein
MTPSAIISLVLTHGPAVVELIARLNALRVAGDKPLTDADFEDLQRLASKTSADYLREASARTP